MSKLHQLYLIHHPKIFNLSNQTYFLNPKTKTYFKTVSSNNSNSNPFTINPKNYPNIKITKF